MIFRQVTKTIWQSDEADAIKTCVESSRWLELGLRGVICPAYNVRVPYAPGLAALILPIWDTTMIDDAWFDQAVEFHRRFSPTLVHCHGGLNRSVGFAAALAWSEGQSLDKSWTIMKGEPVFKEIRDSVARWVELRKNFPK